ncbi:hypothetical protein NONO_c42920 [Nocardia nova SH22a]|uniref:DUF4822 domain-containing protein n=1 Tax=Nocardia nova SH22a TaxID=1415166 RepID=W5TPA7_9NOCA|nr:DUF4822 domain-containing protein [Nocardia nova]AHH19076.1 hypothetical protein NONO_c42920 [Nocardia nova SH22a]
MNKLAPVLATLAAAGLLAACGSTGDHADAPAPAATTTATDHAVPGSPAAALAATPWETTAAKDAHGAPVALDDANVASYVGFAYFHDDGTFTMVNLDDSPKMHGDWSVSPDGRTRTLVAKDDAGQVRFTRVVDIVTLDDSEFTYRVHPDAADGSVYFDIVHTPTTHPEPAA